MNIIKPEWTVVPMTNNWFVTQDTEELINWLETTVGSDNWTFRTKHINDSNPIFSFLNADDAAVFLLKFGK